MLTIGEKFSHYKIISAIGAGGMGEVYLAEDTLLERKVALKFLSAAHAQDEERLRRFTQEARAASALNHQNILTIYEIGESGGIRYIAAEYIEGETLRALLQRSRLTIDEILDIAIQALSAISAAHAAGIVHRDIKPENIMIRSDRFVKVLDFGLAKLSEPPASERGPAASEDSTRAQINTTPGMVMGTVTYMSPEQARGKKVDARTDIWSLGVVLFEMITGSPPFEGETVSDMLAAILKTEPKPLSSYSPNMPPELEFIIKKALGKDREERYQIVKDFLLDLRITRREVESGQIASDIGLATDPSVQLTRPAVPLMTVPITGPIRWRWIAGLAAVLIAGFAAGYLWIGSRETETNLLSALTSSQITSWKSELSDIDPSRARFSPDGKIVAYLATKNGKKSVWLKQIGGGEPFTRKQDDESEETSPLWSPDGGQIAFLSTRGGQRGIWTTPALGGSPLLLAPIEARRQGLVHWSKDGSTIFFEKGTNLYTLNIAAREISKLTNFDESQIIEHGFSVSPDEKQIVYVDKSDEQRDLWVAQTNGGNPVRLTNDISDDSSPIWHPDGKRIIYNSIRNGIKQIYIAFLDVRPPVQLSLSDSDNIVSDISTDGTKVLYKSSKDDSDLWSFNLDGGKEFQLTSDIGAEFWQDAAPNGEAIAYQAVLRSSGSGKLLQSSIFSQKTNGEGRQIQLSPNGFNPRWSPDGGHLAFLRSAAGSNSLWITSATGGDERVLTVGGIVFGGYSQLPYNRFQTQDYQWSRDSHSLIYCAYRDGISNIWQVAIDGTGERQLTRNEDRKLLFFNPLFSTDGEQIAWSAMTTGDPSQRVWSLWLLTGENARQIYESESVLRLVGWSQTGRELIVKSVERNKDLSLLPDEIDLFRFALDDGSTRTIGKLKAAYFRNIALSPDRKAIAFVTRQAGSDSIQIFPSTGGTTKTLISSNDARVYFSSLAWSPDGKILYYGKQANWQIISMVDNFK